MKEGLKTKSVDSANATYHKENNETVSSSRLYSRDVWLDQYKKISNHLLIINF